VREKHALNRRTLCRLFVDIEDHSDYMHNKCARVVFFVAFCKADGDGDDPMSRLLFASDASGNDDEDADEDMPRQKRRRLKEEEEEVESQDQGNSADLGDGEDAEEAEDVDVEEAEDEEAVGGGDSGDASDDGAPSASSKARSERTNPVIRKKWPALTLKAEAVNKKSLPRKSATDAENPGKGISGKCGMCLKTSAKVRSLTSHLSFHCNAGILPYILTLRVNVYYGRVATGSSPQNAARIVHIAQSRDTSLANLLCVSVDVCLHLVWHAYEARHDIAQCLIF
jgi:hypothetical protein